MNKQNVDRPGFQVFAAALYAMSVMLIILPFSEVAAQIGWRVQPGLLAWRTGVVGVLGSMTATPMFGLILAIVTAYVCNHFRTLRVLSVITALTTLLVIGLIALFSLDAMQMRSALREDLRPGFTISVTKALINFGVTIITLIITTVATFRAGWGAKVKTAKREARVGTLDTPLLIERTR
jgi:hypothetical protein